MSHGRGQYPVAWPVVFAVGSAGLEAPWGAGSTPQIVADDDARISAPQFWSRAGRWG
jgi:hypothetical protein